jgi:hypothetical protein
MNTIPTTQMRVEMTDENCWRHGETEYTVTFRMPRDTVVADIVKFVYDKQQEAYGATA